MGDRLKDRNTFFNELKNDKESFQHHHCCGCIPTCVRNILKFYDIKNRNGDDWSQKDVIEYFNNSVPSQNKQCQICNEFFSEEPTFNIMKIFEKYSPFNKQYQVKISPDEDDKEIKEKVLSSEIQLRDYILKKLFEIAVGDAPRPVLVSLLSLNGQNFHICIVTEINDNEVNLFDPAPGKGLIKISRASFNGCLFLGGGGSHSTVCYVCNKSS